jgi:ribonuclease P protein component
LATRSALQAVFTAGSTAHGSAVVVKALGRCDEAPTRAAVVSGRKIGVAVRRNRAKRRLRAALAQSVLPSGYDLVLIARPKALTASFDALCEEVAGVSAAAAARAAACPGSSMDTR